MPSAQTDRRADRARAPRGWTRRRRGRANGAIAPLGVVRAYQCGMGSTLCTCAGGQRALRLVAGWRNLRRATARPCAAPAALASHSRCTWKTPRGKRYVCERVRERECSKDPLAWRIVVYYTHLGHFDIRDENFLQVCAKIIIDGVEVCCKSIASNDKAVFDGALSLPPSPSLSHSHSPSLSSLSLSLPPLSLPPSFPPSLAACANMCVGCAFACVP